jgi:hypothetical protein
VKVSLDALRACPAPQVGSVRDDLLEWEHSWFLLACKRRIKQKQKMKSRQTSWIFFNREIAIFDFRLIKDEMGIFISG